MNSKRKSLFVTAVLGIAWVVAVAFGLRMLLNYESASGAVGDVPQSWPTTSGLVRDPAQPTLVMLAHPHCPCTRASMGELAKIMANAQGKVRTYVLFFKPAGSSADWAETDLRRSAAAIPGVTAITDIDGTEARRFGAETSGHCLLFGRNGHLLFSGGITESRGHAGGNAGETAVAAILNNQPADRTKTLVFGCSLVNRTAETEKMSCGK